MNAVLFFPAHKEEKPVEKERKTEPSTFGRIPKLNDKTTDRNNSPRPTEKNDRDKIDKLLKEKDRARLEREKLEKEKERLRLERERIDRDLERLTKDRERLDKTKARLENGRTSDKPRSSGDSIKKSIDLKAQNTYRIDKNSNDKKLNSRNDERQTNGPSSQGKVPKLSKEQIWKNGLKDRIAVAKNNSDNRPENGKKLSDKVPSKRPDDTTKPQPGPSKSKISNSFDFDKHVNSLKKGQVGKNGTRQFPPGDVKRKPHPDDRRKPNR